MQRHFEDRKRADEIEAKNLENLKHGSWNIF